MAVPLEDSDKNPEGIGRAQAQRDSAQEAPAPISPLPTAGRLREPPRRGAAPLLSGRAPRSGRKSGRGFRLKASNFHRFLY